MWRHSALVALAIALPIFCLAGGAHAQDSEIDCDAFMKNSDGSWTVVKKVFIPVQNVRVNEGTVFRPGTTFLGDDMTVRLSKACPNKQVAAPADVAQPQPQLQQPQPGRVPLIAVCRCKWEYRRATAHLRADRRRLHRGCEFFPLLVQRLVLRHGKETRDQSGESSLCHSQRGRLLQNQSRPQADRRDGLLVEVKPHAAHPQRLPAPSF